MVCSLRVDGEIRGMVAELLYKYRDVIQSQIGRILGDTDYVSVHYLWKRSERMKEYSKMKKIYQKAAVRLRSRYEMRRFDPTASKRGGQRIQQ
jgi:hypothetical protein